MELCEFMFRNSMCSLHSPGRTGFAKFITSQVERSEPKLEILVVSRLFAKAAENLKNISLDIT